MRALTWIGITALSSAIFAGCASGEENETSGAAQGAGGSGSGGNATGGSANGGSANGGSANGGSANGGSGGTGGMGGGGAGGTGGAGGVTYTGSILDGFNQNQLAGVNVCSLDPVLPCVVTNAIGAFTYPGVPSNTRIRVGASLTNYFPIETLIDTTDQDGTLNAFMINQGLIAIVVAGLPGNPTFDSSKALVSVLVTDGANQPLPNYAVSLAPSAGEGPYYLNAAGDNIDNTLTATSTIGLGFFFNVDLANYDVTVSGPGTCTAAFITDAPNTHTAPLINPAQFVIVFNCQ